MRRPSWASTASERSVGCWVTKNTPTPLERISRTVRSSASRNASVASANSRCASSRNTTSLGCGRSPASGSDSNSSATSHISAVDHSAGLSWTSASSTQETIPRPSGAIAQQVGDVELRLAEELRPAAGLEAEERAQEHADGRRRQPADALELGLAGVGVEVHQQRAQVGQVEQRQALGVGVVEDEREAGLLRLVRPEHLGQQLRAEVAHRRADRARPARARRARGTRPGTPRARTAARGRPSASRPRRPARPARRARTRRP